MKQKLFLTLALVIAGMMYVNAQVSIGSNQNPHSAAVLDLKSTTKGLKLPMVALSDDLSVFKLNPETDKTTAEGMMVYNTTDGNVYIWNGSKWRIISGTGSAGGSTSCTGVNFNIVFKNSSGNTPTSVCPGTFLTGYKLTVTGGASPYTFTSDRFEADGTMKDLTMPTSDLYLSFTVTDANGCSLAYTVRIPVQKSGCGTVVNPVTVAGMTFMDRNLGADPDAEPVPATYSPGTNANPTGKLNGDYYQWGRIADGHQKWNSKTVAGPTSVDDGTGQIPPNSTSYYGKFITNNTSAPYDWKVVQNGALWTATGSAADPCPDGYRVPTQAEWSKVVNATQFWLAGANGRVIGSNLFLPGAGWRTNAGIVTGVGNGYYWSSTVNGVNAYYYYGHSSATNTNSAVRAYGMPIRCIKKS